MCVYNEWPSVVRLDVVLYTRYFGDRFLPGVLVVRPRRTRRMQSARGFRGYGTRASANDNYYCYYLQFVYAGGGRIENDGMYGHRYTAEGFNEIKKKKSKRGVCRSPCVHVC